MAETFHERMLKMMGLDLSDALEKYEQFQSMQANILARLTAIEEHLMTAVPVKKAVDAFIPADTAAALLPGDNSAEVAAEVADHGAGPLDSGTGDQSEHHD